MDFMKSKIRQRKKKGCLVKKLCQAMKRFNRPLVIIVDKVFNSFFEQSVIFLHRSILWYVDCRISGRISDAKGFRLWRQSFVHKKISRI